MKSVIYLFLFSKLRKSKISWIASTTIWEIIKIQTRGLFHWKDQSFSIKNHETEYLLFVLSSLHAVLAQVLLSVYNRPCRVKETTGRAGHPALSIQDVESYSLCVCAQLCILHEVTIESYMRPGARVPYTHIQEAYWGGRLFLCYNVEQIIEHFINIYFVLCHHVIMDNGAVQS